MPSVWRIFVVASLFCLVPPGTVGAQSASLPYPRLWSISPCAGQAGTSVRLTLDGLDLDAPCELHFFPSGPVTKRVELPPAQPGKPAPPTFDVTFPAGTAPGLYELRTLNSFGYSNSRVFRICTEPVRAEHEPNDDVPQAEPIPLDEFLYGAIGTPVDVDYFRVAGKAGQDLVVSVEAQNLDSRLDPELSAYGSSGQLLAAGERRGGRNAWLAMKLPADGQAWLRLHQAAHRSGDSQHFYLLRVSAQPWLHAASSPRPDGGCRGYGFNLASAQTLSPASRTAYWQGADLMGHHPRQHSWRTKPPEWLGREVEWYRAEGFGNWLPRLPGSKPLLAVPAPRPIPLAWPASVEGWLHDERTPPTFQFSAKKGQVLVAEAFAKRLGSPVDLHLEFRKLAGTLLDEFDEPAEPLRSRRFFAQSDDPKAVLRIPEDGEYLLVVGCRDRRWRFDPRSYYQLELRAARPDFQLVTLDDPTQSPGSSYWARDSHRPVEVLVRRLEGFAGPIRLRVEGLPAGVTAEPQVLPAAADSTQFIVSITPDAKAANGPWRIVGTASIDGQEVARPADAGTLVWPMPGDPAVPAIARHTAESLFSIREAPPVTLRRSLAEISTVPGSTIAIPLRLARHSPDAGGAFTLVPLVLPAGAAFANNQPTVPIAAGQQEILPTVNIPAKTAPGEYCLVFAVAGAVPLARQVGAAKTPVQIQEACAPIRLVVHAAPPETKLAPPVGSSK